MIVEAKEWLEDHKDDLVQCNRVEGLLSGVRLEVCLGRQERSKEIGFQSFYDKRGLADKFYMCRNCTLPQEFIKNKISRKENKIMNVHLQGKKNELIQRVYKILKDYGRAMSVSELRSELLKVWPASAGGYSKNTLKGKNFMIHLRGSEKFIIHRFSYVIMISLKEWVGTEKGLVSQEKLDSMKSNIIEVGDVPEQEEDYFQGNYNSGQGLNINIRIMVDFPIWVKEFLQNLSLDFKNSQ